MAVSLTVLLAMLGLALDAGRLFIARSELQAFADAAAMAAVRQLDGTQTGVQAANAVALSGPMGATRPNGYYFGTLLAPNVTPRYGTTFSGTYDTYATASASATNQYRFISVSTTANLPLSFLPVLIGIPASYPVAASAVAGQQAQNSVAAGGLIPFAPEAHNVSDLENFGFTVGVKYTLKWGNGNTTNCAGDAGFTSTLSPSGHGFVDIGQGNANSAIRDAIISGGYPNANSTPSSVYAGMTLSGVPGNRGASIFGAMSTRSSQDTDQTSTNWAQYRAAGTGNGRRIVTAPISNPATWSGNGANASVTILGFGNFLIDRDDDIGGNSGPLCAAYVGPGSLNGISSGTSDATKIYFNMLYR